MVLYIIADIILNSKKESAVFSPSAGQAAVCLCFAAYGKIIKKPAFCPPVPASVFLIRHRTKIQKQKRRAHARVAAPPTVRHMSLILFLILFVALWLLIEILSVVMKLTGLEIGKARFQIISILTHTGFTTRESELIVQHPVRRRIASILMIISYVAQVTLITLLFDMLGNASVSAVNTVVALAAVLLFIVLVTKSKYLSSHFARFTEKLLKNKIKKANSAGRIDQLLNLSPDFGIYEIIVDPDSFICGKTLREVHLKEHFIQILKIDRGSEMLDFPTADTQVHAGDRMIAYGKIDALTKMIVG